MHTKHFRVLASKVLSLVKTFSPSITLLCTPNTSGYWLPKYSRLSKRFHRPSRYYAHQTLQGTDFQSALACQNVFTVHHATMHTKHFRVLASKVLSLVKTFSPSITLLSTPNTSGYWLPKYSRSLKRFHRPSRYYAHQTLQGTGFQSALACQNVFTVHHATMHTKHFKVLASKVLSLVKTFSPSITLLCTPNTSGYWLPKCSRLSKRFHRPSRYYAHQTLQGTGFQSALACQNVFTVHHATMHTKHFKVLASKVLSLVKTFSPSITLLCTPNTSGYWLPKCSRLSKRFHRPSRYYAHQTLQGTGFQSALACQNVFTVYHAIMHTKHFKVLASKVLSLVKTFSPSITLLCTPKHLRYWLPK